MKIIKPGTKFSELEKPIRFTCHSCGCVFEMTFRELKSWPRTTNRNTTYAECPNCKAWAEETVLR